MQNRYFILHRLVHWATALLVLGLLAAGLLFIFVGHDGLKTILGEQLTSSIYTYHKAFGIVVLGLALVGVFFRVLFGTPDYDPPLSAIFRVPSGWVQALMYMILVAMPLIGWAGSNAAGHPVQVFDYLMPTLVGQDKLLAEKLFWMHGLLGWVLMGLVAIHILAALLHAKILRDKVTERMSLF